MLEDVRSELGWPFTCNLFLCSRFHVHTLPLSALTVAHNCHPLGLSIFKSSAVQKTSWPTKPPPPPSNYGDWHEVRIMLVISKPDIMGQLRKYQPANLLCLYAPPKHTLRSSKLRVGHATAALGTGTERSLAVGERMVRRALGIERSRTKKGLQQVTNQPLWNNPLPLPHSTGLLASGQMDPPCGNVTLLTHPDPALVDLLGSVLQGCARLPLLSLGSPTPQLKITRLWCEPQHKS